MMNTRSFLRSTIAVSLLLFGSHAANAACVISGVRPTVPLPTMDLGQDFLFIATADCETLRFRVPGTPFTKMPKAGSDTGTRDRTYKVRLTESEWNSVVDESDTTFTWSITGMTSAGVTTRVTTTNELDRSDALDLSLADAKLVGEEAYDYAGCVSAAGDVDGDGHDDLLVGAYGNDEGGSNAGAAYLVLGPVTGNLDLSLADAKFVGEEVDDYAGCYPFPDLSRSVSGAGDVDGDGNDDVLVGALGNDEGGSYAGAAYLVLGPVTGALDLSMADARLVGEWPNDGAGIVSDAGDVNGDGHDDILIGALDYGSGWGAAYLVLGPVTGTLDLSLADAILVGDGASWGGDYAGHSLSGAGDVNGDGHHDLLVGGNGNGDYYDGGYFSGAAYLVLGPVTGTLDLYLADAKLVGEADIDSASNVSGAGDVDADGHDDLLVGAGGNDEGGSDAGAAYIVLGPVTGTLDLSMADAKLVGETPGDGAGIVSGAGDVDDDGHDDVLVGAFYNSEGGSTAGAAYLVRGPMTGTLDLSLSDAKLVGEEAADHAGISVSGAGDVDGDGHDDLMVGAYWNDEGGDAAGAAYLLYGGGLF